MDFDEVAASFPIGLFEVESTALTDDRKTTVLEAFDLLLPVAFFSFIRAVEVSSWITFTFEFVVAFKVRDRLSTNGRASGFDVFGDMSRLTTESLMVF